MGPKVIWPGPAKATTGETQNLINPGALFIANFFWVDNFIWPTNDVKNIQMALGKKKVPRFLKWKFNVSFCVHICIDFKIVDLWHFYYVGKA